MENAQVLNQLFPNPPIKDQLLLIVDTSGSMGNMKSDAEGGINSFITTQQKDPRGANLLLVEFATDVRPQANTDINAVLPYVMRPQGGTALYDAIGQTITQYTHVGDEKVIVVIVTDGEENRSREYSKTAVTELIKLRQDQGWEFVFLGASLDTFAEAHSLGLSAGAIQYSDKNVGGYERGFTASSGYVTSLRNKTKDEALVDLQAIKSQLGDVK